MNWVICDVPCSATGVLRRNPDQKWNYTDEKLWELVGKHKVIKIETKTNLTKIHFTLEFVQDHYPN